MNIPFKQYWQLLAHYLRPRRLRVFVLATLLHGMGLVLYILLWIFVPLEKLAKVSDTSSSN